MYDNGFWVFGYGSLMWQPGFTYAQKSLARLDGFRRAFCMTSVHYRGTDAVPGLVLALDPHDGAGCGGVAYYVASDHAKGTLEYLRERELVSYAYYESNQTITLHEGAEVLALCYVVDRDHAQYAGHASLSDQADIIAHAHGSAGPNWEYLQNTVEHLDALGISDPELSTLHDLVGSRRG